ncbi:MAG: DUF4276 family protein [Ardenticatenia bacterium]|nr:DUF4276 family protein [Ardenticatenia bacterium]
MIVLLAEGRTEIALKEYLKRFLDQRATAEGKPKVALCTKDIMTLNRGRLRRRIRLELGKPRVLAVVGLIDVHPDFQSADDAKRFLSEAARNHPDFHAHAAQYEVEAWLLPYWNAICRRVGVTRAAPGHNPEQVDLERPPSSRLAELYRLAKPPRKYVKTAEMSAILRNQDLTVAADRCPEFKALLNTLLAVAGLSPLG